MRRFLLLVLVLALVLGACSDDDADTSTTSDDSSTTSVTSSSTTSTTTSTTTSSTTSTTTTTTIPEGSGSLLNGLPAEDEELLERRVIAVKIDNHPSARPQSGLLQADAIVETLVEGGITRFIALFHDNDSEYLGPIRSGRPTDPSIVEAVDAVFAVSGAQPAVLDAFAAQGVALIGEGSEGMFRISGRAAPHNLYADTEGLRNEAARREFHDDFHGPLYDVAPWDELPDEEATRIDLDFPYDHSISWVFDEGRYLRFEGTREHQWLEGEGGSAQQIAVDVLVVVEGRYYVSGSGHPSTDTLGTGDAHIFFDGRVLHATWSRDAIDEPFELTADGEPVTVPPGLPWITLLPSNSSIDWTP